MSDFIDSILEHDAVTGLTSNLSMGTFFLCIAISVIIGFGISIVYMITHKKEGFAQS